MDTFGSICALLGMIIAPLALMVYCINRQFMKKFSKIVIAGIIFLLIGLFLS